MAKALLRRVSARSQPSQKTCHPERSEGSAFCSARETLCFGSNTKGSPRYFFFFAARGAKYPRRASTFNASRSTFTFNR
jgi:hypothetical protein